MEIAIAIRLAQLAISGATTLAEAHMRSQILGDKLRAMGNRNPTEADWIQLAFETDAAVEIGRRRALEAREFLGNA